MASDAGVAHYDYLRVKHKFESKALKYIPPDLLPQPVIKVSELVMMIMPTGDH